MATLPRFAERAPAAVLPATNRIPRTLLAAVALLVVAAVGLLQVLQTSHAATAGYELRALERERAELSAQVRLLEAEIAVTAAESQVRELAMARLGMVPANEPIRVTVDVPAPALMPLPERYVVRPQAVPPPEPAWWEQVLHFVPGLD